MNKHHHCECRHKNVKYCSHCKVVYCEDCNQEWVTRQTGWYYRDPWYNTTVTYKSSEPVDTTPIITCSH